MVVVKRIYTVFGETVGKNENRFALLKHPKKHWVPPRHYTQTALIESVSLRWLDVARDPLWRGARLDEIGQIGIKPAPTLLTRSNIFRKRLFFI